MGLILGGNAYNDFHLFISPAIQNHRKDDFPNLHYAIALSGFEDAREHLQAVASEIELDFVRVSIWLLVTVDSYRRTLRQRVHRVDSLNHANATIPRPSRLVPHHHG